MAGAETVAPGPFGGTGEEAACTCGAAPHPQIEGRCERGHVVAGNGLALVAGEHSRAFWAAEAGARREIQDSVIADAGYGKDDAPRALSLAAQSIAQAAIVRDSAYARLAEAGGPLSSRGRTRRAFVVWLQATDRLEKHLRLVGLRRVPKPAPSLVDYLDQRGETS